MPCGTSSDQSERARMIKPALPSYLRLVTLMGLMTPERENGYLGRIWTVLLRGILIFVASGLDINGCVLCYFEGTAHLHCYTSCILTAVHCSQVSFLQCCHMKRYTKIFMKCEGGILISVIYCTSFLCALPTQNSTRFG